MDGYQVVLVWTTGAAVGYAAAKRKGYSPVAGDAAGAVLGPLLAWVLFLIDGIFSSNEMRLCPHCAEWIHPKATACRFCGRDVPKPPGWSIRGNAQRPRETCLPVGSATSREGVRRLATDQSHLVLVNETVLPPPAVEAVT